LSATEQDPVARAAWQSEIVAWDTDQVVFLDETSTHTSFTRTHGRAPKGERVVGQVPRNHGPNISCLAALSPDGIISSLAIAGSVDTAVFTQWLTADLLPRLRPGTTLVLDNLSVHRSATVQALVAGAGCTLRYLPAYSPDFNPIELSFSRLKTQLRSAGERTFDGVVAAIGTSFNTVTAQHAQGWYRHCGYPTPTAQRSQPL
jgi:transposase